MAFAPNPVAMSEDTHRYLFFFSARRGLDITTGHSAMLRLRLSRDLCALSLFEFKANDIEA
jgi:hypothetical protein